MKREILTYWDMTKAVGEVIERDVVVALLTKHFDSTYTFNTYKTAKDEVLQIYNGEECYTIIGGSSDKWEWDSNFNATPLVDNLMHNGFYSASMEVMNHKRFVKRNRMYFVGHSRGGAIASVLCYLTGSRGVGFGVPKAFKKKVNVLGFYNVRNPIDFVCHVVPFFKTVGEVIKVKFFKSPHLGYGKHIKKGATLW